VMETRADGSGSSSKASVTWAKGGSAVILAMTPTTITLRSTVPSPPGSRIEGTFGEGEGGASGLVRVKIHGSRRQEDGSFVLEGRPLDMTKELRERIEGRIG
jgi:hypothetical protein